MNRLVIIGASGHGKVVADTALKCGYQNIIFLDDNAEGELLGFPIVGRVPEAMTLNDGDTDFIIAIGNNITRKMIAEKYDLNWVTLIHPAAVIGSDVQIGAGTVVMAMAVIQPDAVVGEHCIINTHSVVEHDNHIDNFVHICPRAALAGTVHVGECTQIGIGATIRNNISICDNCVIGAGAVVVKGIEESGTYIGVPVKRLEQ